MRYEIVKIADKYAVRRVTLFSTKYVSVNCYTNLYRGLRNILKYCLVDTRDEAFAIVDCLCRVHKIKTQPLPKIKVIWSSYDLKGFDYD